MIISVPSLSDLSLHLTLSSSNTIMSLEYTTLEKCNDQLKTSLGSDFTKLASYIFGEGFINEELYEEVVEPRSINSGDDRANKLMLQIMSQVELEPSNYYKLINHLRHDKKKYTDIINLLDVTYFGLPCHQSGRY